MRRRAAGSEPRLRNILVQQIAAEDERAVTPIHTPLGIPGAAARSFLQRLSDCHTCFFLVGNCLGPDVLAPLRHNLGVLDANARRMLHELPQGRPGGRPCGQRRHDVLACVQCPEQLADILRQSAKIITIYVDECLIWLIALT